MRCLAMVRPLSLLVSQVSVRTSLWGGVIMSARARTHSRLKLGNAVTETEQRTDTRTESHRRRFNP